MGKGKQEVKEKKRIDKLIDAGWSRDEAIRLANMGFGKGTGGGGKAWKVTKKIACGGATIVAIVLGWLLSQGGRSHNTGGNYGSGGESVRTVGSGGKKPGSWSSGRHRQR